MRSHHLTVNQRTQFGILLSAGSSRLLHQLSVECRTTLHRLGIRIESLLQRLLHRHLPVMLPIRHAVIAEILDSILVVIAQQQMSRLQSRAGDLAQVIRISQHRHLLLHILRSRTDLSGQLA